MNPADPREVDIPGAFFQSQPPNPFRPSEFGHLPQHWYAHAMHAVEIIAYRHPDPIVRDQALNLYRKFVSNLHLNPETDREMTERLGEDRMITETVVS
jgi:hypothetical protein